MMNFNVHLIGANGRYGEIVNSFRDMKTAIEWANERKRIYRNDYAVVRASLNTVYTTVKGR